MTTKSKSTQANIDAALKLNGDPDNVQSYYDEWAKTYDADVDSVSYQGPAVAVDLLRECIIPSSDLSLLDAGCGTGLVGQLLAKAGYGNVSGFDLSDSMADRARDSGSYVDVKGGVDIMLVKNHFEVNSYDVILSVGVFTLGHVPPEAMARLLELLKPSGLLVISVRKLYYDETEFQVLLEDLLAKGTVTEVNCLKDAPYNQDGPNETPGLAHYWVLRRND